MAGRSEESPTRIFIWVSPRTCSTALFKCLSYVDDVEIWMEPYQASFYNATLYNPNFRRGDPLAEKMRADLVKNEASDAMQAIRREMEKEMQQFPNIIDQKDISFSWTKSQLEQPPESGTKFILIKDQAMAIIDYLEYLPDVPNCRHVFLIRHPREVYVSSKEAVWKRFVSFTGKSWESCHIAEDAPFAPVKDLFQIQNRLWKHLHKSSEIEPIVIDTFDLLTQPEEMLPKLFSKLAIPYKETYLKWDSGVEFIKKKWKGSADFLLLEQKTVIYERAVNSSHFEAPKQPWGVQAKPELKVTPELAEFIKRGMPFYEEMHSKRLQRNSKFD